MKLTELSRVKNLHHAYLVVGNANKGVPEVLAMLETRGIETKGNADILNTSFVEFGVDDARLLSRFASLRAVGDGKMIIVSWSRATTEAQNALLKVVEEAPGQTVFFFSVDTSGSALETLRSRTIEVEVSDENTHTEDSESVITARSFLSASFEERMKTVESFATKASKTQDRGPVRDFVTALLQLVHSEGTSPATLRDVLDAERYMKVQGSSIKTVLGHLAVTLPRARS